MYIKCGQYAITAKRFILMMNGQAIEMHYHIMKENKKMVA